MNRVKKLIILRRRVVTVTCLSFRMNDRGIPLYIDKNKLSNIRGEFPRLRRSQSVNTVLN